MTCSFAFSSFCRAQHLLLTAEYSHLNHPSQFYNLLSLSISYTKELAHLQNGNGWAHVGTTLDSSVCDEGLSAHPWSAISLWPQLRGQRSRAEPCPQDGVQSSRACCHHVAYRGMNISVPHWLHTRNKVKLHPEVPDAPVAVEHGANTPGLHHRPRFCHI